MTNRTTFRDAVIASLRCAPEKYERAVFQRCLYWHAKLAALLLPHSLFAEDWQMIRAVASDHTLDDVVTTVNRLREINPEEESFMSIFKFRVSGRKIIRLARDLWPEEPRR